MPPVEAADLARLRVLGVHVDGEVVASRHALHQGSVDPDLRRFKRHGGELIQYAGWADTAIAPQNGLNYYRKVQRTMGNVNDFYRVFMVPGMARSGWT